MTPGLGAGPMGGGGLGSGGGGSGGGKVTQSEADQSTAPAEGSMDGRQLAVYDVILTISQAHHVNCAYTDEKTRGLLRKPATFVSSFPC